jgi:hypothetical protein
MNMPSKKMRDEFLKFQPYVPDEHIARGWERMRYFLPQEKKRRGLFFFITRGCVFFAGFALLFFALLQVNKLWLKNDAIKRDRLISIEESKKNFPGEEPVNESKNNKLTKRLNEPEEKSGKIVPETKGTENDNVSIKTNTPDVRINPVAGSFHTIQKESDADGAQPNQISNIPDSIIENEYDSDIKYEKLVPVLVNYIELQPKEDSVTLSVLFIKRNPAMQVAPLKLGFEIFGGPSRSSNYINDGGDVGTTLKQNINTYDLGFAFLYKFRKRWSIMVNAVYNQYNLNYQWKTYGNKMISQGTVFTTSQVAPGFVKDTMITYVPVSFVSQLQSKSNYFINLGIGYSLIEKNRLFLDVYAQFGLRFTRYTLTKNNYTVAGDTARFVKRGNTILADQVNESEEGQSKSYGTRSFGLNTTCVLGYRLNNYLSVIIRPSYFLQMSSDKIGTDTKHFILSQNNLFLNAGIRVKLK